MPSYMYTSASGSNWDDDDEDFDPSVYAGTFAEFGAADLAKVTFANARSALSESQSAAVVEYEQESTDFSAARPQDNYNIHSDYWPSYAGRVTQGWYSDHDRRPAYTALSHADGFVYPYQRARYSANWKAIKLHMGANMKCPMMMALSNLHLSKTWVSDSIGEYVEERGYVQLVPSFPSSRIPTPRLSLDSKSDEQRDEVYTPPDTPIMVQAGNCEVEVEEEQNMVVNIQQYDPTTGAIDLSAQSIKTVKTEMAREFASFSSIAEDLNIHQILDDAGENLSHADINDAAIQLLVSKVEARHAAEILTTTTEAILTAPSPAEEDTKVATAAYNQLGHSEDYASTAPADSTDLTKGTPEPSHCLLSDLKYIEDPTSTLLVWNTVLTRWFAPSSLSWGCIALAAASTLVDVAAFVARH
ncbi:hypothetical protein N0V86_004982 [Didymella sp. IMI 355093]|nr:hypothetical protein N0V86_004982 [Didymella sp. IMI 355093]